MAAVPQEELKVATTINIETAEADDSETLMKDISYRLNRWLELHRPDAETYKFRVEDPERTFQALLNLRETIWAKTLKELKVTLVSGENGVVGAAYEGNWYLGSLPVLSRFTIVETENSAEYKRLEVSVKHTYTGSNPSHAGTKVETWVFEVRQREADGAWELVFVMKYGKIMTNLELILYIPAAIFLGIILLALLTLAFPLTIYSMFQTPKDKKEAMLPLYRYLLGSNQINRPRNVQRGTQRQGKVGGKSQAREEAEALRIIFDLFKSGALTQEEFEIQKRKIIEA